MKGNWYGIAFILAIVVVVVSAWPDIKAYLGQRHLGPSSGASGYGQAKVKFSDTTITAEVRLSPELQAKGLGGRTGLAAGSGMLWLYDHPGEYQFWMKDMLIPLDFIWIDQGQIVDLTANVQPPAAGQAITDLRIYQPKTPASAVLEVNAGFIAAQHLSIGNPVEIDRQ